MTAVGKMLSAAAIASMAASANAQTPAVRNVVLVHGAFADGSGWRGVRRADPPRLPGDHRAEPAHVAR